MSDDPVAREAPDEAADARVIDVAEAADASAEALEVLKDAESTMEGVADKLKELPQAYAAIKTIADVLNAGDVGDDEVVAKAAAEDVWTRGKRALRAFAHREEAPAKQSDEGVLARIRGAGKRLVG